MQDPKTWIGAQPSNAVWDENGDWLYFQWNPQGKFIADSLFKVKKDGTEMQQVKGRDQLAVRAQFTGYFGDTKRYNHTLTEKVFSLGGDLFIWKPSGIERLTQTNYAETNPSFSVDNQRIFFVQGGNFFQFNRNQNPQIAQLTDIRNEEKPTDAPPPSAAQTFLNTQQTELFNVIAHRQDNQRAQEEAAERTKVKRMSPFYTQKLRVENLRISPNGRFVSLNLVKDAKNKDTFVADYLAEDGFTTNLSARSKVGILPNEYTFSIIDLQRDSTYTLDFSTLPGFNTVPQFLQEQGITELTGINARKAIPHHLLWNLDGTQAVMIIRTFDNKDRWIIRVDAEKGTFETLSHQHDEAWVAGPGIDWNGSAGSVGWLPDNQHFYFQSEQSGYSHLYLVHVSTGHIQQLTDGNFEVFNPQISKDGRFFYFTSSEDSPYERHFYKMPVLGGNRTKLTDKVGNNAVVLSPNEDISGNLYSYSNQPTELWLQKLGKPAQQITQSTTQAWKDYAWRDPQIIEFLASDGIKVPARIYKPEQPNGAAVIFVHGAGYLQNVHKWWSIYFREYMFHNLLTDLGYVVLDVDYRASSGYGRDFRTATYRHMGGRDLQDFVDASKYIQSSFQIPADKIGIYGGSYGGFITLMALFTEGKHFGAGAALRSVTDWAHYNHGYTANILNTPATDSLAIARSSPIYYAEGLEDPLLICHGVVDTNVHVQDVIRLSQRLIELGKEDWELALYPVEDHGFVEPSSWTDEYKRILKLFEQMRKR